MARDSFSSDLVEAAMQRPTPVAVILARTRRQFGIGLSCPDERVSIGVGPGDRPLGGLGAGYLPPTRRIAGSAEDIELCGRRLHLRGAPGETADHLVV